MPWLDAEALRKAPWLTRFCCMCANHALVFGAGRYAGQMCTRLWQCRSLKRTPPSR